MNNDEIYFKFDQEEFKFYFYNKNKNLLGSFTVTKLIKYITDSCVNDDIIEMFLCKREIATKNITIINHLESPFTGNIDIMLKLYHGLLNNDDNNCDLKNFIILLSNHMLKIISCISDVIKNDLTKNDLKRSLLNHSIFITNKINNMMHKLIDIKFIEYSELQNNINNLEEISELKNKKYSDLKSLVDEQNKKIDKIITNIEPHDDVNNNCVDTISDDTFTAPSFNQPIHQFAGHSNTHSNDHPNDHPNTHPNVPPNKIPRDDQNSFNDSDFGFDDGFANTKTTNKSNKLMYLSD